MFWLKNHYSLHLFNKTWCFVLQGLPASAVDHETHDSSKKLIAYEITKIITQHDTEERVINQNHSHVKVEHTSEFLFGIY